MKWIHTRKHHIDLSKIFEIVYPGRVTVRIDVSMILEFSMVTALKTLTENCFFII